ncbi:uncharacterized protein LOC131947669 [Physella acuta]|uniref:uncharacterized protein LOC131947669 n=1 Tax=Physella acuta TaxID=109671 RepID=UPI0027DBDEE5|nr:uncharacterized protein LOC131947669 [Physella acuta]XP_059164911.1 uncharacterized protein LOC131947669 [Physella acuta]
MMGSQSISQVYNSDDKCCRICHDDGGREKLVSPCYCSGSVGFVHVSCLKKWLGLNGRTSCELCSYTFPMVKVYPAVWQYFKVPLDQLLLKDILCLFMFIATFIFLCIASVVCFKLMGKMDTEIVFLMLIFSLFGLLFFFFLIVDIIVYRCKDILIWRKENSLTQMALDKTPPPIIRAQAHQAQTSLTCQTQGGMPVFLTPTYSNDPTGSLAANGNGNANINVAHTQLPAGSEFQRVADGDETNDFRSFSEERLLSNENAWTIPQQNGINNITTSVDTRSSKTHRRRVRHRSCGLSLLGHDDLCSAFRVYKPNPNATDIQLPVVQRNVAQVDTNEFFTFPKHVFLCKENARSHKIANNEMNEIDDVESKNTNNIRRGSKTERRMSRHRSRATDKTVGSSTDGQSLVTQGLALLGHDDLCSAFRVYKPNPNASHIQLPVVQRVAAQDDTNEFFTFPKHVFLCKENARSPKIDNNEMNKIADVESKNTNNILSRMVRKGSKSERRMPRHRSRATDKKVGSSTDGQSLVTQGLSLLGQDEWTSAFKVYKPK